VAPAARQVSSGHSRPARSDPRVVQFSMLASATLPDWTAQCISSAAGHPAEAVEAAGAAAERFRNPDLHAAQAAGPFLSKSASSVVDMMCLLLQGIPRKQVKLQAAALLGRVKLTEAASVRTGSYSGGMRRRLSVSIALLGARSPLL